MIPTRRDLIALAGAALLASVAACQPAAPPHKFNAVDLTGAEYARKFDLPDVDGRERTLADFRGKAVLVFFGYTQCPDACPTTMAELAQVKKLLGADGSRTQVVFVSVDPERDTPLLLKNYVTNFGSDFVGLRGSNAQVKETAREFKVFYEKVPGKTPDSYSMDHTSGVFVFDPQGRIRLFARAGMEPADLAADTKALLDGSA
ncbi:MAG TPA: SCO family protein [Burkholderiaceae bacterium]|jgi:protein SCO1/2|nr:SCO family protein [Burkholderiaceae bacterium]